MAGKATQACLNKLMLWFLVDVHQVQMLLLKQRPRPEQFTLTVSKEQVDASVTNKQRVLYTLMQNAQQQK